jgi:hypothetical protein
VTALTMLLALRCSSRARFTEPRSASALTSISASCTTSLVSDTFCCVVWPAVTATPVTSFG